MTREKQIGILIVCAVLAFAMLGATDRNVFAWFTFGVTLATLALSGRIDDGAWRRPFSAPRRRRHGALTRFTT